MGLLEPARYTQNLATEQEVEVAGRAGFGTGGIQFHVRYEAGAGAIVQSGAFDPFARGSWLVSRALLLIFLRALAKRHEYLCVGIFARSDSNSSSPAVSVRLALVVE